MGLDDLRPLSFIAVHERGPIPLYATEATAAVCVTLLTVIETF